MKNPAAGGGRWVDVAPERITGWIDGFAGRHGGIALASWDPSLVAFTAADGSLAECQPPFPPMPTPPVPIQPVSAPPVPIQPVPIPPPLVTPLVLAADVAAAALAEHAGAARTVGVLLVRLGGYAAGIFAGSPARLVASKTGSRLVHGRSAAGGWSQHRFARRREKQANEALAAAADAAARIFGDAGTLDAVVLGGDKRAIDALRDDPRLAPYLARAQDRFLTVPDPKLSVLRDSPRAWRAIRIRVVDPP